VSRPTVFRRKSIEWAKSLAEEKGHRLQRELGPVPLFFYTIGAVIGAGIFVLPGTVAAHDAGPAVPISFLIGGIVTLAVALMYVEFAAMVPVAGSAYTYTYVSLGEIFAWIVGWDLIFEFTVIVATVAVGWSGYVNSLFHAMGFPLGEALTHNPFEGGVANLLAALGVSFVAAISLRGIRLVGQVSERLTWLKLLAILTFLGVGIAHIHPKNWQPFLSFGWEGVLRGAALTFFAYTGFDGVTAVLEEVKNPERTIPRVLLSAILTIVALYVGVAAVLTGVVPFTHLDVPNPVAFAFREMGLPAGEGLIALAILFGLLATMLANGTNGSRILFAMGRDGLLPELLGRVHPTTRTPHVAESFVFGTAALLATFFPVHTLAELANIGGLSAFFLTTLSVLVLRVTRPDTVRPFRVPAVWLVGLIGLAGTATLIASLPWVTFVRFGIWLLLGLVVYVTYGFRHARAG